MVAMLYRYSSLVGLATVLLLSACSQTPPADNNIVTEYVNLKTEPQQARDIDPTSRVIGESHAFHVTKMRSTTNNNVLKVQVDVLNDRGRGDILYYRMRWMDLTGMMQGQYAPWETERFEGGQSSVLSFQAPADQVTDFRLEFKPQY